MHKKAPLRGEVITQYKATSRADLKAIDDYRRVTLELMAIWANAPQLTAVN
ncbi:hypothetical protein [Oerskovia sp. Root22]|uniref:hypothetical protein n=1 Tax=Oerskovia sp. Root22 TaxID=1736494 RepID=UPI000AEC4364|nr:hypothetical protein [Oerskovia sp. Root22]